VAVRLSVSAGCVAYVAALSSEVVLAYISRPFELAISRHLNAGIASAAALAGAVVASAAGWAIGIAVVAGSAFIIRLVRSAAYYRPGALTPVWLGVAGLLVEAFTISYIWIGK
jgi:hypothetical protein